jgi:hypothetical protein
MNLTKKIQIRELPGDFPTCNFHDWVYNIKFGVENTSVNNEQQ